ncbi:MAG TPA: hypothetical protein DDW94_06995 [Deltaproteobacteria bacterium]|nr:MAG: hypothetical protein A2Z79_01525 [Deltaproteobacteria bacterium GWA2_55_82]OIJ74107.1 MAG: hypothetical protein A2V21_307435 [Deltaproteobacteria bacterium GWC2_55_46]HBG46721.1 hypothetical protein [Deltaproteobacteria bacterium]HCY11271.1 hypothetical protein [Deltaproteobacteria bacterium]
MRQNLLILIDFTKKLFKSRQMLWAMALRDMKSKYIGSVFGFAWSILNPLSQVLVFGVVFGLIFQTRPDPIYGTDSFVLYLLSGLLPWQFFSQGVTSAMVSVTTNSNLVKKAVGFPSELLPVVTTISSLISHAIGMALFLVILVAFEWRLPFYAPYLLVYLFLLTLFTIGLGWVLSSVSVYLRDVRQVIDMVMMAWFFFTPVFFSTANIQNGLLLTILKLNPMYYVIEGYRLTLLAGRPPEATGLAYVAVVSFVMFGVGGIFFRRLKPGFAEAL